MSRPFLKPFSGILLNSDKVGDVARCVCPPYDVVSSVRTYYERDPFNVIRLELPMPNPSMDQYSTANETLSNWLRDGVLKVDGGDTVYLYEQVFSLDGATFTRKGMITLVAVDKGRILTHEETKAKAKEDRKRLLTTTKTFTSIVFSLYDDKAKEIDGLIEGSGKELIHDFIDEQAIRNRFLRMTGKKEIEALQGLMETRNVYIADGHHRFDVSVRLGIPYMPMYLTNMHSPGIVILPYHRTVKLAERRSVAALLDLAESYFAIERVQAGSSLQPVLDRIAGSKRPSFALVGADEPDFLYVMEQKKPVPVEGSSSEVLSSLKVNIIHSGVMKGLLKIRDDEISFTHEPSKAVTGVRDGTTDLAFLLPPTDVEEVKAVADGSLIMPPKSTFFYPKVLTGLVFHRYE